MRAMGSVQSVKHSCVHILPELHARLRRRDDGHDEEPRHDGGEVMGDVARDGAAEQVGKHQAEDNGLERHVNPLLRSALDWSVR